MATPSTPLRLSQTTLRPLRSTAARPFAQPPPPPARTLSHRPAAALFRSSIINSHAWTSRTSRMRGLHTTPPSPRERRKPIAHNREEVPDQPPPTDFGQLDVLGSAPVPTTSVDICHEDGFSLNSGVHIAGGSGALLVGGEAFVWRPWEAGSGNSKVGGGGRGKRLVNAKGQWEVGEEGFAILGMVWPRPDLLILGLGPEMRPLSPVTRRAISNLGMRVEVLDTRNAASQYNMLATERGVEDVAAALIPIGWKEGAQ
ncbi:hypothetical protein C8A01DRAFT_13182 [Parachaetomium inaequale]|uniref:NADH dehydrogenase [ubiquinone] 1 alpha subcomplex assembly factor 3 n=1 Tax=Parachaetomium inaequale TaxID=2588326 RepID=A0AAN6PQ91_9PEZI|nr:hypothetical protein C8A01DRAFT_13182 [Parachaetomium inaequale]